MEKTFDIPILFHDEFLIVVNKPVDLPVHRNDFMPHDAPYLTKIVGDMFGKWIYNVHRLDAKTSGTIVLALSSEVAHGLTLQFERKEVAKKYNTIILNVPGEGTYDRKVKIKKKSKFKKPAVTHFTTLETWKTSISYKDKVDVELSLVQARPESGRWHQIRQHFALHHHDIVGDSVHGDFTLNRILTELTGIDRLMLHSSELVFTHPVNGKIISISSEIPDDFIKMKTFFCL